MARQGAVTCPRCGSESIYYRDVCIKVDYDYLAYGGDGRIYWTEDTWDSDYFDLYDGEAKPVDDGSVGCEHLDCGANWPSIEALEEEIRQKQISANLPPFGGLAITHY